MPGDEDARAGGADASLEPSSPPLPLPPGVNAEFIAKIVAKMGEVDALMGGRRHFGEWVFFSSFLGWWGWGGVVWLRFFLMRSTAWEYSHQRAVRRREPSGEGAGVAAGAGVCGEGGRGGAADVSGVVSGGAWLLLSVWVPGCGHVGCGVEGCGGGREGLGGL